MTSATFCFQRSLLRLSIVICNLSTGDPGRVWVGLGGEFITIKFYAGRFIAFQVEFAAFVGLIWFNWFGFLASIWTIFSVHRGEALRYNSLVHF